MTEQIPPFPSANDIEETYVCVLSPFSFANPLSRWNFIKFGVDKILVQDINKGIEPSLVCCTLPFSFTPFLTPF